LLAALQGFAVIATVTAVGVIAGCRGVLGDDAKVVLNRTAFHIGVPALVLISLADAEPSQVFSLTLLALTVAALTSYGISFLVSTVAMGRTRQEATIGAMLASYSNAGYLGIPLSSYVFGSTTAVSSLIVFQVLVLVPISMAILDSQSSQHCSAKRRVAGLVANPIIASSGVGLLLSLTEVALPQVIRDSLELLAALAVPTVLLAFGISLSARASGPRTGRGNLVVAVLLKTVLMPALAYALARWVLGVNPHQLMIVSVLAALPAAQNINTYAELYRCGEATARDATLLSTVVSIPVILAIVSLAGS
jgi:malonate transporter and related proteins